MGRLAFGEIPDGTPELAIPVSTFRWASLTLNPPYGTGIGMLSALEVAMFLAGLISLLAGIISLTPGRTIRGAPARLLALCRRVISPPPPLSVATPL